MKQSAEIKDGVMYLLKKATFKTEHGEVTIRTRQNILTGEGVTDYFLKNNSGVDQTLYEQGLPFKTPTGYQSACEVFDLRTWRWN